MKKAVVLLAAAVMAGSAAAQTVGAPRTVRLSPRDAWMRQMEAGGSLVYHMPGLGDFDVFDQAIGVEFAYRYWFSDVFGIGAGLGYETWEAAGDNRNWEGQFDGDMTVIPLSVSGLLRIADFQWGLLTGFVSVEYAICDSDMSVTRDGMTGRVGIDDSINGRLGLELSVPVNDVWSVGLTLGYQGALMKGDASALGDTNIEVDMQSVFVGLGASFAF
jgi:hypothetical protein